MHSQPIALEADELIECSKCLNFSLPLKHDSSFVLNGKVTYLSFNEHAELKQVIIGEPDSYLDEDLLRAHNLHKFKEDLQLSLYNQDEVTLIIDTSEKKILTLAKQLPKKIIPPNLPQLMIKLFDGGTDGGGGAVWP